MLILEIDRTVRKIIFLSLSVNFEGLPDLGELLTVLVSLNFFNAFRTQPSETPTNFAIATLDWFPCLFITTNKKKIGN